METTNKPEVLTGINVKQIVAVKVWFEAVKPYRLETFTEFSFWTFRKETESWWVAEDGTRMYREEWFTEDSEYRTEVRDGFLTPIRRAYARIYMPNDFFVTRYFDSDDEAGAFINELKRLNPDIHFRENM